MVGRKTAALRSMICNKLLMIVGKNNQKSNYVSIRKKKSMKLTSMQVTG